MRFLVETHKEERRARVEEGGRQERRKERTYFYSDFSIYIYITKALKSVCQRASAPPSEILITKVRILHNVSTDRHIFNVMSTLWNMSQRLKRMRFCHLRQCG